MNSSKAIGYISKHRITLLTVIVFAAALICVLSFTGNKTAEGIDSNREYTEDAVYASVGNEDTEGKDGYGLYIDEKLVVVSESEANIETAISNVLGRMVAELGITDADERSFRNEIQVIRGYYPESAFCDVMAVEKVIETAELNVVTVQTVTEDILLQHDVKKVYTDALKDGKVNVVTEGVDGEAIDTYDIISIDGEVVERVLVNTEVVTEKVDSVVKVGTKLGNMETASLGVLAKPYDGYISSYYGSRWGKLHAGLDLCKKGGSCKGDPALAAAGGTIIWAETKGGYGNCVIIDHGNGMQTLYGHLMKYNVKAGDVVETGDTIGFIGTTGISTGYHLHFEVHIDGQPVNPLLFVSYE